MDARYKLGSHLLSSPQVVKKIEVWLEYHQACKQLHIFLKTSQQEMWRETLNKSQLEMLIGRKS